MHTKTEWLIDKDDKTFVYALDHDINRFSCRIQNDNQLATQEELEANARLIATAPKLLEACEILVEIAKNRKGDEFITLHEDSFVIDAIKEAVAEAKGNL